MGSAGGPARPARVVPDPARILVTESMALDWAASPDENQRRARLSSFLPGAHEPESQIEARGLPGTSNCCPVHAS